ncbi:hypothetical protein XAB3213_3210004 [Xanthomonas citri pv. bilvae]|nr:hypothetical protein XAB3213_3210004 [Xanthomonas citri pv. bilvae]
MSSLACLADNAVPICNPGVLGADASTTSAASTRTGEPTQDLTAASVGRNALGNSTGINAHGSCCCLFCIDVARPGHRHAASGCLRCGSACRSRCLTGFPDPAGICRVLHSHSSFGSTNTGFTGASFVEWSSCKADRAVGLTEDCVTRRRPPFDWNQTE